MRLRYGESVDVVFDPLAADEPIGVIALSGPVDTRQLDLGLALLESWGRPVVVAPNVRSRTGYLAGADEERLAGLDWVLDRGVRTLLAARGGFGLTRLLGRLPWRRLIGERVRCVGFSDVTALTGPLVERGAGVQIHGPMVTSGLDDPRSAVRLLEVLEGALVGGTLFTFGPEEVVCPGRASGVAKGGNLSLICSLIGTPWQPDFSGAVVFLEEVGEPAYRLDRMLTHLGASAMFRGVKALISGGLCECPDIGERSDEWRALLMSTLPPGVPVVTGLDFGHKAPNLAFPLGTYVTVDTASGRVDWDG